MRGISRGSASLALGSAFAGSLALAYVGCGSSGAGTSPTVMDGSTSGTDATKPGTASDDGAVIGDASAGDASDAGVVGNVDAATACAAYAKAFCAIFEKCSPRTFASFYFDSIGQCETRLAQVCPAELSAPGTATTPGAIARCAQDLAVDTCADWVTSDPPSCYRQGNLPGDAGCEYNSQCQSTLCARGSGLCGTCADRVGQGGRCDRLLLNCQVGLACADNCSGPAQNDNCGGDFGSSCVNPVPEGGACDKQFECMGGLSCIQDACAPAAAIGQPCATWIDCAGDTSCVTQSVGKAACEPNTHAPEGGACNGSTGQCTGSSQCQSGLCEPEPTDGKTCKFNDDCLYPAVCDQGTCKAPDDATGCK